MRAPHPRCPSPHPLRPTPRCRCRCLPQLLRHRPERRRPLAAPPPAVWPGPAVDRPGRSAQLGAAEAPPPRCHCRRSEPPAPAASALRSPCAAGACAGATGLQDCYRACGRFANACRAAGSGAGTRLLRPMRRHCRRRLMQAPSIGPPSLPPVQYTRQRASIQLSARQHPPEARACRRAELLSGVLQADHTAQVRWWGHAARSQGPCKLERTLCAACCSSDGASQRSQKLGTGYQISVAWLQVAAAPASQPAAAAAAAVGSGGSGPCP